MMRGKEGEEREDSSVHCGCLMYVFFFQRKAAYELSAFLVGLEMCLRGSRNC